MALSKLWTNDDKHEEHVLLFLESLNKEGVLVKERWFVPVAYAKNFRKSLWCNTLWKRQFMNLRLTAFHHVLFLTICITKYRNYPDVPFEPRNAENQRIIFQNCSPNWMHITIDYKSNKGFIVKKDIQRFLLNVKKKMRKNKMKFNVILLEVTAWSPDSNDRNDNRDSFRASDRKKISWKWMGLQAGLISPRANLRFIKNIYTPMCNWMECCESTNLKRCAQCKKVLYCGREHQKRDWNFIHRNICK